jgi:hypothetical protein
VFRQNSGFTARTVWLEWVAAVTGSAFAATGSGADTVATTVAETATGVAAVTRATFAGVASATGFAADSREVTIRVATKAEATTIVGSGSFDGAAIVEAAAIASGATAGVEPGFVDRAVGIGAVVTAVVVAAVFTTNAGAADSGGTDSNAGAVETIRAGDSTGFLARGSFSLRSWPWT